MLITELEASLGLVSGLTKVSLRGINAAISNSAETVWNAGSTYALLTSASAMEIISADANDAAAGTGARTVTISGVGASDALQTETVTMNGTNAVALANTYRGINSARVATAGSNKTNVGALTVRTVAGSVTKCQINASATLGAGQSADFIYTVPSGYRALLKTIYYSATGVTGDLTLFLRSHNSSGLVTVEASGKSSLYVAGFNAAIGTVELGQGYVFDAGTCLELQAVVSAGAGALVAHADLYLHKTSVKLGRLA